MNRQTDNEQLLVPEMKKRCDVAASQVLKTFQLNPYVSVNALVTASEKRKKDVFTISLLELIFDYFIRMANNEVCNTEGIFPTKEM